MATDTRDRTGPGVNVRHFIRAWRNARGMKIKQLAEAADISISSLSHLERGHIGYTQKTLEALAGALNVSPGALLDADPDIGEMGNWDKLQSLTVDRQQEVARFLEFQYQQQKSETA